MEAAYAQASHDVFIFMVPIMGLCLVLFVFIKDRGLSTKEAKTAAVDPESASPQEHVQVQQSGKDGSPSDTGSARTSTESGGRKLATHAS